jgi:hypothetical protein
MTPTADQLREILDFDASTGIFTWKRKAGTGAKANQFNAKYSGRQAGSHGKDGYVRICVNNVEGVRRKEYLAHQLVWLLTHGVWPDMAIDHIDRNKSNNRPSNLRLATRSINGINRNLMSNNTSGTTGVARNRTYWVAYIFKNKHRYTLGHFPTRELAVIARTAAEAELYPGIKLRP